MFLTSSLVGSWHCVELWGHTPFLLLAILAFVCTLEVILWKMTTSTSQADMDHEGDYEGADEYEEDIYYEDLQSNYDQIARRQMRYRQRQQQQQQEQLINQLMGAGAADMTALASSSYYESQASNAGIFRFFH